jgi:hypothetical protein
VVKTAIDLMVKDSIDQYGKEPSIGDALFDFIRQHDPELLRRAAKGQDKVEDK